MGVSHIFTWWDIPWQYTQDYINFLIYLPNCSKINKHQRNSHFLESMTYFRITKKHMKFVLTRIKQESESLENLEKCKIKTANFWVTLLSLILHFSFPIGFAHHNFFPKFDKLHGGWKVILCQLVKPSSWNIVYFFPFRLTVDLPYPHLLWWF